MSNRTQALSWRKYDTAISSGEEVHRMIRACPRALSLREAMDHIIKCVHQLPNLMQCELSQVTIYIGRAASNSQRVVQRWRRRRNGFIPRYVAICVRGWTSHVRGEAWEKAAQRVIKTLQRRRALCCANVYIGSTGRWPGHRETVIYVAAGKRRGPAGPDVKEPKLRKAIADMVQDSRLDISLACAVGTRLSEFTDTAAS